MAEDDRKLMANITPFGLRMQPELKARIEAAAKVSNRSMNAEIVARLDQSFSFWPRLSLPPELHARAMAAAPSAREGAEWQLNEAVRSYLEKLFPPPRADIELLYEMFDSVVRDAPEEDRPRLRDDFQRLIGGIYGGDAPEDLE